jgi:hypothetical protein
MINEPEGGDVDAMIKKEFEYAVGYCEFYG